MKKLNLVSKIATLFCLSIVIAPSIASAELFRQLQVGSRGTDVSELQSFLAMDVYVYPQGLVTGYFGSLTQAAVRRFQTKNGISPVGRVGPQTLAAINMQMGPLVEAAPGFTSATGVTLSGNVATFNVNTNIPTRAAVYYSTSPIQASENDNVRPVTVTVSGTGVQANTTLQQTHNIPSFALESNRTYYFMVVVKDANGVVSVTYPKSFQSNS